MVVAVAVGSRPGPEEKPEEDYPFLKSSNPRSQVGKNVVTEADAKTGTHPHRYTPAAAFGILWLAETLGLLPPPRTEYIASILDPTCESCLIFRRMKPCHVSIILHTSSANQFHAV